MVTLINLLALIIPVLLTVAFLTLAERKVLGYMQTRKGPNIVGPYGVLQPFADGIKLFIKEPIKPLFSTFMIFLLSPILALTLALLLWTPLPLPSSTIDLNLPILFFLALSSLAVFSILGSGWASNSKYALMGALRAVAQTISYEVVMALILLSLLLITGNFSLTSFNTTQEVLPLFLPCWPLAVMWFTSIMAETNRAPFDLTEGESELVSGFNVEYAGGPFALFFLAEYSNILLMSTLTAILFFGTTHLLFMPDISTYLTMAKMVLVTTLFLWVRASYPRFRYDQLMHLTWKAFLPLTLALLLFNNSLIYALVGTPPM
uniref:NADH-ubiquinone oxidoreductase chain 1 n=1 Tax=Porichthys myriaster TaxID=262771 RepID=Q5GM92_9TELE|nr:NADH dehydrogenase subunit 1 [Porichthys myriaster]